VAVVTKPFSFEGAQRKEISERGYNNLRDKVDAIITIDNDRLLQVIDKKTSLLDAFKICDDVLRQGVQGISEIITVPALVNVDFNDVKTIMKDAGSALMGIGHGSGENRAVEAAKSAISSPLLETSIDGAKGVLFTITGGPDLRMHEVDEAAKIITQSTDSNVKVIFGVIISDEMKDEVRITVIATGFSDKDKQKIEAAQFGVKAPSYTPSEFVEQKTKPEEPTVVRRLPKLPLRRTPEPEVETSAEDDELEIPAFIRKKMK
jgi:cell division protein FtsZ